MVRKQIGGKAQWLCVTLSKSVTIKNQKELVQIRENTQGRHLPTCLIGTATKLPTWRKTKNSLYLKVL